MIPRPDGAPRAPLPGRALFFWDTRPPSSCGQYRGTLAASVAPCSHSHSVRRASAAAAAITTGQTTASSDGQAGDNTSGAANAATSITDPGNPSINFYPIHLAANSAGYAHLSCWMLVETGQAIPGRVKMAPRDLKRPPRIVASTQEPMDQSTAGPADPMAASIRGDVRGLSPIAALKPKKDSQTHAEPSPHPSSPLAVYQLEVTPPHL